MRAPTQAAHVLGKLLTHVGDNVVWGTDCLFYGSPQPQIQAFRAFHISSEFQERYGYPALTKELEGEGARAERRAYTASRPSRRAATSHGRSSHGSGRSSATATGCWAGDVRRVRRRSRAPLVRGLDVAGLRVAPPDPSDHDPGRNERGDPGLRSVVALATVIVLAVLAVPASAHTPTASTRAPPIAGTAAPATTSAPTCSATACSCGAGGPIPRRPGGSRHAFLRPGAKEWRGGVMFPSRTRDGCAGPSGQTRTTPIRSCRGGSALASPTTGGATRPRSSSCSASSPSSSGYRSAAVSWFPYGPLPEAHQAPHLAAITSASCTPRPLPSAKVSPAANESPAPYVSTIGPGGDRRVDAARAVARLVPAAANAVGSDDQAGWRVSSPRRTPRTGRCRCRRRRRGGGRPRRAGPRRGWSRRVPRAAGRAERVHVAGREVHRVHVPQLDPREPSAGVGSRRRPSVVIVRSPFASTNTTARRVGSSRIAASTRTPSSSSRRRDHAPRSSSPSAVKVQSPARRASWTAVDRPAPAGLLPSVGRVHDVAGPAGRARGGRTRSTRGVRPPRSACAAA